MGSGDGIEESAHHCICRKISILVQDKVRKLGDGDDPKIFPYFYSFSRILNYIFFRHTDLLVGKE